jgi:hypothetical protein
MLVRQQLARLFDELIHEAHRFFGIRLERAHRQREHAGLSRISFGQCVTQSRAAHYKGETMLLDHPDKKLNFVLDGVVTENAEVTGTTAWRDSRPAQ